MSVWFWNQYLIAGTISAEINEEIFWQLLLHFDEPDGAWTKVGMSGDGAIERWLLLAMCGVSDCHALLAALRLHGRDVEHEICNICGLFSFSSSNFWYNKSHIWLKKSDFRNPKSHDRFLCASHLRAQANYYQVDLQGIFVILLMLANKGCRLLK